MLRAEAGHSVSVAAGVDNAPALTQKLRRAQVLLYDDYDWPFLRETWTIDLQAGQRYYDLPQNPNGDRLDMERIERVTIDYSGRPVPLERGINDEQYAQTNSDNGERAGPCRRWDIKRTTAAAEQIEAWPIPVDNTNIMGFKGIRRLRSLINPEDQCDLDDQLIVLTAAAEILARQGAKDAPLVQQAAGARLKQLKARTKGASRMITMSGSSRDAELRNRGKTIIRIGS